jgi:hypothetical protein
VWLCPVSVMADGGGRHTSNVSHKRVGCRIIVVKLPFFAYQKKPTGLLCSNSAIPPQLLSCCETDKNIIFPPRTSHLNHHHDDPTAIAHSRPQRHRRPSNFIRRSFYTLPTVCRRLFQRNSFGPITSAIHQTVAMALFLEPILLLTNKSTPEPYHNDTSAN